MPLNQNQILRWRSLFQSAWIRNFDDREKILQPTQPAAEFWKKHGPWSKGK